MMQWDATQGVSWSQFVLYVLMSDTATDANDISKQFPNLYAILVNAQMK